MKCRIDTDRFILEIISSSNWKKGEPINPKIPKWLVKVTDRFTQDEYYPTDMEFALLSKTMDEDEIFLLSAIVKLKERHNRANLKNPENRAIEAYIHQLSEAGGSGREHTT